MRLAGLNGFDFEVSQLNCDTLAKDTSMNVFISQPGHNTKVLIFKYIPSGFPGDLPVITSPTRHSFEISVNRVADIFCYSREWNNLSFVYHIRLVEFPDEVAESCR